MKLEAAKESLDIIKYYTICKIPEDGYQWEEPEDGKDIEVSFDITFEEAVHGKEKKICYQRNGKEKRILLKIPAGVDEGCVVRVKGYGEPGKNDGKYGDLRVQVHVGSHAKFVRRGMDIYSREEIEYDIARDGGYVLIDTIDGLMGYNIPKDMKDGMQIRLDAKGVPMLKKDGLRGDHYVTFYKKKGKRGEDIRTSVTISFMEAVTGVEKEVTIQDKQIKIPIPAGIEDGYEVEFKRQGKPGLGDGEAGSLFVSIYIEENEKFKRKGSDIYSTETIEPYIARYGGTVFIDTLEGVMEYQLKQPIQSGTKLYLKQKGILKPGCKVVRGDQIVTLLVKR